MDITEPRVSSEEILVLLDDDFNPRNVCIVTGASGGIGRAIAVAAAANNLLVVGLDVNEAEGSKNSRDGQRNGRPDGLPSHGPYKR